MKYTRPKFSVSIGGHNVTQEEWDAIFKPKTVDTAKPAPNDSDSDTLRKSSLPCDATLIERSPYS